jgi:drug/metabolite transporter (DMT)-like permease
VNARPELVLVGVTVLWASTFVITKGILREMAPLPFLCVRFAIGATLLLLIYRRRLRRLTRATLRDGVVLGLLNSTGLLLQVFGQAYTTASKSAFVTSLNTPLVPVVGLVLYGTRPTRPKLIAVCLATLGVALLTWPGAGARWNDGDLLTVGCAILYALTIVEIARRTPRHDAMLLTVVQVVTAFLLFAVCFGVVRGILAQVPLWKLPEMLRLEARPFTVTPHGWVAILYMGSVCTVLSFAGQTWAMGRMSATHAAVIFALEPVFATVMAITVEGSAEWPSARGATGAVLVMIAVLVSEIRLVRRGPS